MGRGRPGPDGAAGCSGAARPSSAAAGHRGRHLRQHGLQYSGHAGARDDGLNLFGDGGWSPAQSQLVSPMEMRLPCGHNAVTPPTISAGGLTAAAPSTPGGGPAGSVDPSTPGGGPAGSVDAASAAAPPPAVPFGAAPADGLGVCTVPILSSRPAVTCHQSSGRENRSSQNRQAQEQKAQKAYTWCLDLSIEPECWFCASHPRQATLFRPVRSQGRSRSRTHR